MAGESSERMIELPGLTQGAATEHLVAIAQRLGYSVVSSGPGAFRLARTRRTMLVRKQVESVVATVFGDRGGTRARFVGAVDPLLVGGLTDLVESAMRPTIGGAAVPAMPIVAHQPAPSTVPHRPSDLSAHIPAQGLLIDSPWSAPVTATPSPPASSHQAPSMPGPDRSPLGPAGEAELEGYTIARSALRARRAASLALPDGRTIELTSPIVVGRNPDATRGPAGAVAVAHADPSLSKTHAILEAEGGRVYVTDLHSTNGTVLESSSGRSPCAPTVRVAVPDHAVVRLGDVAINVTAAP